MYMIVYVIYRYNTDICVIMCVYLCNMCIQTQYKIDPRLGQCKTTLICSTFLSSKSRLPCLNKKQRSRYLFLRDLARRRYEKNLKQRGPCELGSKIKARPGLTHGVTEWRTFWIFLVSDSV